LVVAAEGGAEGEKEAGELAAWKGMFGGWLLPRVSSDSARARRSTKTFTPDCAKCSAALFFSSARNFTASVGGGYSTREVKNQLF
jgi:hypothetical protein